jgi:FkbM family methyltransferase
MATLQLRLTHLKLLSEIWRHFQSPWLITLLRLGIIRIPYFPYRLALGGKPLTMLARPTTTSMADLFVLREVFVNEAYKDVLPLLNGRKNIRLLDIGANLGSFTIWMDRKVGVQEAFCFEPEPDSFRLLEFNLRTNNCASAKCLPWAVGGEARTINISLKKDSPGGTNIYGGPSSESTSVPVVALEEWLKKVDGDFDVLKIDCEGAEWEIFRKTPPACFKRFRVLLGEAHGDPEKKQSVSEFKGLVEKLGFRTVRWDNMSQGLYFGVRDGGPS